MFQEAPGVSEWEDTNRTFSRKKNSVLGILESTAITSTALNGISKSAAVQSRIFSLLQHWVGLVVWCSLQNNIIQRNLSPCPLLLQHIMIPSLILEHLRKMHLSYGRKFACIIMDQNAQLSSMYFLDFIQTREWQCSIFSLVALLTHTHTLFNVSAL